MRIALIGSRELHRKPQYHCDIPLCEKVAYRLAQLGHTFTSGLCYTGGMDKIAQCMYSKALAEGIVTPAHFEVYVASQNLIDSNPLPNKHLSILRNPDLIAETEELCLQVLGEQHWSRCNAYARGMHSRNCHQILGYNLDHPVDAVITWTPAGAKVGGTKTALLISELHNIPIFNLGLPNKKAVLQEIAEFLKSKE